MSGMFACTNSSRQPFKTRTKNCAPRSARLKHRWLTWQRWTLYKRTQTWSQQTFTASLPVGVAFVLGKDIRSVVCPKQGRHNNGRRKNGRNKNGRHNSGRHKCGSIPARLHRMLKGNLHMANHPGCFLLQEAQAVARQYQLTFGCTRLQEFE